MRTTSFALLSCFLVAATCCNHTPYWRLVSKDCYEDIQARFIKDSAYYREVEQVLIPYLDSVSYAQRTDFELNGIDSLITNKQVAATLTRFLKRGNMLGMSIENKNVYFTHYCTSETHSGSHSSIVGDLTFNAGIAIADEQDCHDSIYCINYRLSERWNYTTVVMH